MTRNVFGLIQIGFLVATVALAGCGGGEGGESGVVSAVGTVDDEQSLTVGDEPQTLTLGRGQTRVELSVEPNSVARREPIIVRVETNIAKRGATPVGGATLHVASRAVSFQPNARMRQVIPPPPPRRQYVAVHAQAGSDEWVPRGMPRVIGAAPPSDGGVPTDGSAPPTDGSSMDAVGGPSDAGTDLVLLPAEAEQVVEIDVEGSGLWAVALIDEAPLLFTLSSTSGMAGAAFTLMVTGEAFGSDATVIFDGQALSTTRMSAELLQADVPATRVQQAGQYSVWVQNGTGATASRSNPLYYTVSAVPGAPIIVDYSPDNGVAGDKVLILGRDLTGANLTIKDSAGLAVAAGAAGSVPWWGQTLQSIEITLPQGWKTGPIVISNEMGSYRGKIFNVGQNLARIPGAAPQASSEYSASWPAPQGADNKLVTSWFSAVGDCASLPQSCKTIPWFRINFPSAQTVERIAFRGNREYMSGYDFIRGKFEVLGPNDVVFWGASYDLPLPDRDLDILLPSPIAGAFAVKFTSEVDESVEPGLAELEAFGP